MSLPKTQAFFREFEFLKDLKPHVPADISVKVSRADDPDFTNTKVPTCGSEMQGHVLLYSSKGELLYSLARTRRKLNPIGFDVPKNWKFGLVCLIIVILGIFTLCLTDICEVKNGAGVVLCFDFCVFCAWVSSPSKPWASNYNESIDQALKQLGERADEVAYIAVHNDQWDNKQLTLYKTPKGYSLGQWVEFQRQLAQKELRREIEVLDAEGQKKIVELRKLLAQSATRDEHNTCSQCGSKDETGTFCSHCGATFQFPVAISLRLH